MTNARVFGGLVVSVALLASAGGTAAASDGDARVAAKERFSHGVYLAENGAYAAALGEFEKAQELAPSRLNLYQIAMAYVALDQPVDALDSLDEVLSADGTLKSEYVERAKAAKEEQQRRIGELDVKVNVPATIEVDGERVGEAPLKAPLKVAAGEHVVAIIAPGYVPVRQSFAVAGLGRAELAFELQATEAKLARVTVQSPLPAAEVRVDDVLVGKTPLAEPVTVLPGKHVFELQRAGYMTTHRTLNLGDGVYSGVGFDPDEDESAGAPRGRLRLQAGGPGVAVTIDGRERGLYREPIDLPAGPHTLKLERKSYESLERMVDIPGGDETTVKVSLRPTGEARDAVASRVRSRRLWALGPLVGGAVVGGFFGGLAVWSNGKLPAAENKLTIAKQDAAATCPPNDSTIPEVRLKVCEQQVSSAQSDVDKYRNIRLLGFVGAGVGAALVVTGVVLLLTGPSGEPAAVETVAGSLQPVVYTGPDGATFGLRGRF